MGNQNILSLLDSLSDDDLLRYVDFSKEKLAQLEQAFMWEIFEFRNSLMRARNQNERSLEFYVDEQRVFDQREAKLNRVKLALG